MKNQINSTDVVICPRCGGREFYGNLTWALDHRGVCRRCFYDYWKSRDQNWTLTDQPVFPTYKITNRLYKTKDQQEKSMRAAINLIKAAIPEERNPRDKKDRPAMLHSAAELIQDALEWLEDLDE